MDETTVVKLAGGLNVVCFGFWTFLKMLASPTSQFRQEFGKKALKYFLLAFCILFIYLFVFCLQKINLKASQATDALLLNLLKPLVCFFPLFFSLGNNLLSLFLLRFQTQVSDIFNLDTLPSTAIACVTRFPTL